MSARILFFAALLFTQFVTADQAQWVDKPIAEKAKGLIDAALEVRHFCSLCEDKAYRREQVGYTEIVETETAGKFEVLVNSAPIDLAYVYVESDGKWANLGKLSGATVDSVPEILPADLPAGLPDFDRLNYVGLLDGKLMITVELSKYSEDMNGSYYYSHVGTPLYLSGKTDALGTFTLDETDAEGTRTGTFSGKLVEGGAKAEGSWLSGDGAKKLDFKLTRIALHGDESGSLIAGSQGSEVHLDFPVFLPGYGPGYNAVNETVQQVIRKEYAIYATQFATTAAELGLDEPRMMDEGLGQTISIGDARILLATESIVSLYFYVTLYQGGAHGITNSLPLNLRVKKDGEAWKTSPITLKELLKPGADAEAALSKLLIEELKKKNASSVVDGQITAFKPEEMAAFTLSPKGLTFYFDPYAVASYAEGSFQVLVPFEGNEALFNAESLSGIVLK